MARNWSEDARAALDAYPWKNPADKACAAREAELVSFGEAVEVSDLPLAVRRWAAKRARPRFVWNPQPRYVWNGESWRDLVGAFEKAILEQVLERAHGNISAAARLLKTTPRVISYKAKKHGVKNHGIL